MKISSVDLKMSRGGALKGVPCAYVEIGKDTKEVSIPDIMVEIFKLDVDNVVITGENIFEDDGFLVTLMGVIKARNFSVTLDFSFVKDDVGMGDILLHADFIIMHIDTENYNKHDLINVLTDINLPAQVSNAELVVFFDSQEQKDKIYELYKTLELSYLMNPYQLTVCLPKTVEGKDAVKEMVEDRLRVRFHIGNHFVIPIKKGGI